MAEELFDRQTKHAIPAESLRAAVEEATARFRVILTKGSQSTEILGAHLDAVLDLDCVETQRTVHDEVHLVLGPRLPVTQ